MSGNTCPPKLGDLAIKAICNTPTAFSSCFLNDMEFHNYRDVYEEIDYPNLEVGSCSGNRAFRTNANAHESTSGHYLKNVKCTNCHRDGLVYLIEPSANARGWFGGCGQFDCTGLENVLIQDLTGDFLGVEGTIISNNE
jgi:hypothetical protein